jgi:molybdate transport system permease protein
MSAGPREDGGPLNGRPRSPRVVALSDRAFLIAFAVIGGAYVFLIIAMLIANIAYMAGETWRTARQTTTKQQFENLDKNGDGQLSVDDVPVAKREKTRLRLLESCDADDDGKVLLEEFQEAPATTRFKMSDEDSDGKLTLDEFRGQRDVTADVDKTELVFQRIDNNGDRQVTPDEFEVQRHPLLTALMENPVTVALADRKIQYSIWLSLVSCTLSGIFSLWVAVPTGYLLARHRLPGRNVIDAILDIPIVLPPLVVGLSLLILFQFPPFSWVARHVVYQIPAVVLAQFSVACAFAVRTMKATFDHIDPRCEQVALSLGCTRLEAFGWVVLPEAKRGMMTAFTLAWARSLGEFGPLLIFAGVTRMKTEVLSTSVFLEINVGNVEAAVAVSLIMVVAAAAVLTITRLWGSRDLAL